MTQRAALWVRVSTSDQHTENQEAQLRQMAEQRGWDVVRVFRLDGVSAYRGDHRDRLEEALAAAHAGEMDVLCCWSLDRLDRQSATRPFDLLKQFKAVGVEVVSLTEPWASTDGPFADLLALLVGWFANFESQRRSERIKAGLARRKVEGGHIGRKAGAKDKGKRRRSGYYKRWEDKTA